MKLSKILRKTLTILLTAIMVVNIGFISVTAEESKDSALEFITMPSLYKADGGWDVSDTIVVSAKAYKIGVISNNICHFAEAGKEIVLEGLYGELTLSALGETIDGKRTAKVTYSDDKYVEIPTSPNKSIKKYGTLGENAIANDIFTIRIEDANGKYVERNLIIEVTGTNDAPVITIAPSLQIRNQVISPVTETIEVYDADQNDTVSFGNDKIINGTYGDLSFGNLTPVENKKGYYRATITYSPLSFTTDSKDEFTFSVSDSHGGTSELTILVTILVELDISKADEYIELTETGYKVGSAEEKSYTGKYIITGSASRSDNTGSHVRISSGTHNITLENTNIQFNDGSPTDTGTCAFEIQSGSTVHLSLTGTNILKSGAKQAGIQVPTGANLVISEKSTGSLTAISGESAAGIGGNYQGDSGNIEIKGGTITSTSDNGAAIGGGNQGNGGTFDISGGIVTATSNNSGAAIGGGNQGNGGEITIRDHAIIFAAKGPNASNYIGAGKSGASESVNRLGGIIFEGTNGFVYGTEVIPTIDATIPENYELVVEKGKTLIISDDVNLTNNGLIVKIGTINGTIIGNKPINGNLKSNNLLDSPVYLTSSCSPNCSHEVFGSTTSNTIYVQSGTHNITLNNVDINVSALSKTSAFYIADGATVNLTLVGESNLKSSNYRAGIQVSKSAKFLISEDSSGSLTVTGGQCAAGIGSSQNSDGGTIEINGGTINANGGVDAAAIGGGLNGAGGTISIRSPAIIFATKGTNAPNYIGAGLNNPSGDVKRIGGIIFEDTNGFLYDTMLLNKDLTIPNTHTLTIESDKSLMINSNITLNNNGTINGEGFISLLRKSSKVNGSGIGNDTHVKKLLAPDTITMTNTMQDSLPIVTWDGETLIANVDFTISGIVPGSCVPVTITGIGSYHGNVTKYIKVSKSNTDEDNGNKGENILPIPPKNNQNQSNNSNSAKGHISSTPKLTTSLLKQSKSENENILGKKNNDKATDDTSITKGIDRAVNVKKTSTSKNDFLTNIKVFIFDNFISLGVLLIIIVFLLYRKLRRNS